MKKGIITATLIIIFLGVMFGGLFHMSFGMDMFNGMTDCPFSLNQENICTMGATDHIGAWKSVFLSVIPILTTLILAACVITFFTSVAPNLLSKHTYTDFISQKYKQSRSYTFSSRPFQELFADGILHPKLY